MDKIVKKDILEHEKSKADQQYPFAKKIPVRDIYHGREVIDNYRWLETNDSESMDWVAKQNEFTDNYLKNIKGRSAVKKELEGIARISTRSTYAQRENRYFFHKRMPGQDFSIFYYKNGLDGEEIELIDPNKLSTDGSKSLTVSTVSPDGKLIALKITENGSDKSPIQVMEVESKKILDDYIMPTGGGIAWIKDSSGFYYNKYKDLGDSENTPTILFHKLGTSESSDIGIFGSGLPASKLCSMYTSLDRKYLFISVNTSVTNSDIFYKDLEADSEVRQLIVGRDYSFDPTSLGDQVFAITNYKSDRFRMITFDIKHPEEENWKEIIPEGKDVLNGFMIVDGFLLLDYCSNASSLIKLADKSGKIIKTLNFPKIGSVFDQSNEFGSKEVFFGFTSFNIPGTIYSCESPDFNLNKIYEIKVDIELGNIVSEQVWYRSKDGTRLPMFIVHRNDLELSGNSPALIDGYGGFGETQSPYFDYNDACFVHRGGVFVLTNLRGGGEFGEAWHKAGMLDKKQNTFDDFHAAAEFLIENKYTNSKKMAIMGGSNGGLLVGACMVQRPDLYKAVVCGVPLLDMLRYDKFGIATYWRTEYGSAENKNEFEYILKYSPYHNVKDNVDYPAVLFVTADTDTRVNPMHARKMAALMQNKNLSNIVLLRTELKAGHGFGKPVSKEIESWTDRMSFIYDQLGMI